MSVAATIVAVLAVAGILVSWFAGAVFFLQATRTAPGPARMSDALVAVAAWPFLTARVKDAPAGHAARVNKALVALFVCLMVAVAAVSLATNLSRISR